MEMLIFSHLVTSGIRNIGHLIEDVQEEPCKHSNVEQGALGWAEVPKIKRSKWPFITECEN